MFFWLFMTFFLFLYYLYYECHAKRRPYPPGPMPLPVFGNLFQIGKERQKTVRKWSATYGPVFTLWLPKPYVLITDYDVMKNSIVKEGDAYAGRPKQFFFEAFTHNAPHIGLAFANGPYWKEHRRFVLHVLRDFGFGKQLMEGKVATEVQRTVDYVTSNLDASGKTVVDPHELFSVCTGSIISCIVFGHPYEHGDKDFLVLKKLIAEHFQLSSQPAWMLLESFPWLRHMPFFGHFKYDDMIEQEKKFRKFFYAEIDAHKRALEPGTEPSDYLDAFLKERLRREQTGEEVGSFHDDQLFYVAFNLWSGAMESMTTTMGWMFLYLIHYPQVQARIYKELDAVVGPESKPSYSGHRNRLPYLVATLNEIQRHANVLPVNVPRANIRDVILNGHHVPANTTIIPQIGAVLKSDKIFPNPEKFDPERFLDADGNLKKVEQFIPFSLGKRVCLGESLARMELFSVLACFVHKFKIEGVAERPLPTMEPNPKIITATAHHPYEITLTKREA